MKQWAIRLGCLGLMSACSAQTQIHQEKKSPAEAPETVKVFKLQMEQVAKKIRLPGELYPYRKVSVHAKIQGFVKRIHFDMGSFVKAGEVLAELEAPENRAKLAEARTRVQSAQAKADNSLAVYQRLLAASKTRGVIAPIELERARSQMQADKAELEALKYTVTSFRSIDDYLVIRAPFSGRVTQRHVDVGTLVGTTNDTALLELEQQGTLRLRVAVPEALSSSELKQNQALFTVKSLPGKTFEGRLARKAGSLDPKTRSEIWEFEVLNGAGQLKSGMFADVGLELARKQPSFVVPASAVVTNLERKFVIRIRNRKVEWVDVGPGLTLPDKLEVFGKLKPGDLIALKGNEELLEESQVMPKLEEVPKPKS